MSAIEEKPRHFSWRQGDIISPNYNSVLIVASIDKKPVRSENSILCIISQDCDIVLSEDKEPFIELIKGEILEKESNQYSNLKSPRILDIQIGSRTVRFSIHDRFRVLKGTFNGLERYKDFQIDSTGKDILRRWISRRYVRAAFPDAFTLRLQKNNAFRRLLKSDLVRDVYGIWIDIEDNELPDGNPYQIRVIVGVQDNIDSEILKKLELAFDDAFLKCSDIIITDI